MFTVTDFTATVWTETEELASGVDLWLSVLIRNKFPSLTREQPHMVTAPATSTQWAGHGALSELGTIHSSKCNLTYHCPKYHFPKHFILQKLGGKQIKLKMKTDREKNQGLCDRSGGAASRSGLQRGIFPDQSSLTASLPQERKKSQESENSGQKKSLQTK